MLDTLELLYELKETFEDRQAETLARLMGKIYKEAANTVIKVEFEELRKTVSELATNVKELAKAQRRTEERVNELAEAQRRTEERVNRLEEVVTELAETQKKTEEAIKTLTEELKDVKEQVGGLSHTVGYTLENEAYKVLPALLKRDYQLEVIGRLKRSYLTDNKGQAIEVNIIGEARRKGKKIFIVGESKVKLSKNDVKRFIERRVNRLKPELGEIFPVIITHMISEPHVEDYAKEKGVVIYYSYDF